MLVIGPGVPCGRVPPSFASAAADPPLELLREKSESGFHPSSVYRRGDVIVKDAHPWTPTVHTLLRHLHDAGFREAPLPVGSGFDDQGHELLTYVEGEFVQPHAWSLEGAAATGDLLRRLHEATASYHPPKDAIWQPLPIRTLGGSRRIVSHCDTAPWNIVARPSPNPPHRLMPVGLIDFDYAGPVDPLFELAQLCWYNAQLHDDVVAARVGLPPLEERAQHLRAIVDAYDLPASKRRAFVTKILELVILETAAEVDCARVTPDTKSADCDPQFAWGVAWHARGAAWILRHRAILQAALR